MRATMASAKILQKSPALPLLRMFGLGAIAIVACVWALVREKPDPRQLMYRNAAPSPSAVPLGAADEIEIELWPAPSAAPQ